MEYDNAGNIDGKERAVVVVARIRQIDSILPRLHIGIDFSILLIRFSICLSRPEYTANSTQLAYLLRWQRLSDSVMQRSGVRPSVCPVGILTITHQGPAYDAASEYFGPKIRKPTYLL